MQKPAHFHTQSGITNRHRLILLAFLAAGQVMAGETNSEPASSGIRRWMEQDYMFGTWNGARSMLSQHGVDFEFFYAASNPNNLDGGLNRGGIYQGAFLMAMDLDSQKLVGYEGGTFHASGLWLHGREPFSASYSGDMNRVNMIDFPNAARLWEMWYQQKFFDGKVSVKLGNLSVDRDFIVPEYYGSLGQASLINQTFFYPSLAFNLFDIPGMPPRKHGLPSTPSTAPGVVVKWQLCPQIYAQAGVYSEPVDQTYSGTQFDIRGNQGVLSYYEAGYRLNARADQPGLEGSYKIGGYYHTGDFVDVYDGVTWAFYNAAGFPAPDVRNHQGNYGLYLLAEQQVWREKEKSDPAKQGLVAFFRLSGAPSDRNLTQLGIDGGLVFRGIIPGRDWDSLALAASYLKLSDDIRRGQQDANALAPDSFVLSDHETVLEASYKIQATAWWTIQPSLQHVFHPGGSAAIPDATVLILQSTFRF